MEQQWKKDGRMNARILMVGVASLVIGSRDVMITVFSKNEKSNSTAAIRFSRREIRRTSLGAASMIDELGG